MKRKSKSGHGEGRTVGSLPFYMVPENIIIILLLLSSVAVVLYASHGQGLLDWLKFSGGGKCRDCNVILITIDSLRWDHLGYMGYPRNTSPFIDELASEGVVFTSAFAQSTFTPPSLASILTSKYVSDHGLKVWGRLDDNHTTLPEVLEAHGYQTFAVTRVPKLFEQNLNQGIQETSQGNYWRADDFNNAALEWIDGKPEGKFFLWLHYYDPHRRYEPPPPFDKIFNRRYNLKRDLQRKDKAFFQNFWKGNINLSKRQQWELITQYDGEIAFTDQQLGLLLGNLSERGLLDNSIVVISADHGEGLNEHTEDRRRMFVHDPLLYDQVVRVPLVFWGSRIPGGVVVDNLVESIDITPTILSILDIDYNQTGMYGMDLTPFFGDEVVEPRSEVYSECWGWEEMKMVRSERYKYIRDIRHDREELYDLSRDGKERRDIIRRAGNITEEFRLKMDSFMNRHVHTPAKETNLSRGLERRLRELGYIY
jgi:arylsulfatase A-like enzyme